LAELLLGSPIFPGSSAVDQLVEIVRVLGTPSKEEVKSMNQNYQDYKSFPVVRPPSWSSIFKAGTPPESMDLCAKLLTYIPTKRYKAIEVRNINCLSVPLSKATAFPLTIPPSNYEKYTLTPPSPFLSFPSIH